MPSTRKLDLVNGVDGRDRQPPAVRSAPGQVRRPGGHGKMPSSRPSGSKTQTPSATAT